MEKSNWNKIVKDNRRISILMEQWTNRALKKEGLTISQVHILLYISQQPDGASLTALHHASGYAKASLCATIKRLRERGYLRSEPCKKDDRSKLLFLTEKRLQVQKVLEETMEQNLQRLEENFLPEESDALDRLQTKLLQNLPAWMQQL